MINDTAYYTVQGWMRSKLGLSGNALAVYAIIYGFTQDGCSEYAGSAKYLSEWLGCSKRTILTVLSELTERGLLLKRTIYNNGVTFCNYTAVPPAEMSTPSTHAEISPPVKNFHGGGEKISPGVVKKFHIII